MSKRIVDIGDLYEGTDELEELGDADLALAGEDELGEMGTYTTSDLGLAFQNGARGGFMMGALIGGLLGVGVGAMGGALVTHHYMAKKP